MSTLLITGANRGLGLEFVKEYLAAGWEVLACCRHPESATALLKLAQEHQNQLTLFKLDVTHSEDIVALAAQLRNQPVDLLLNNAGIFSAKAKQFGSTKTDSWDQVQAEEWLSVLKTNTLAPLLITQALINNLQQGKLKIIANMSSALGSIENNAEGDHYAYRCSKVALNAITKNLSIDLKEMGITVISLSPGWVKTDMGGPDAKITVEESVKALKEILDQLKIKDSGRFIGYEGVELCW